MILPLTLLIALSQSASAAAPANAIPAPGMTQPAPPQVVGDRAVIPLEFTAGLPTITANIGGKPLKLGFDTGSVGPLRLSDSAVAALGLQKGGEVQVSDPSGRNPRTVPIYPLASLTLGSLEVRNWRASGMAMRMPKLEALDGIIGLAAFRGYVVTIDYPGRQLRIERGALPPADGKRVFEYGPSPIPSVPLTVEGKTLKAHIDTGNVAGALIVPTAFAQQLSRRDEAMVVGKARTVSNVLELKAVPIRAARVGGVQLDTREVTYPSVINSANIGSKALSGLVLKVDPANGRVALDRGSRT